MGLPLIKKLAQFFFILKKKLAKKLAKKFFFLYIYEVSVKMICILFASYVCITKGFLTKKSLNFIYSICSEGSSFSSARKNSKARVYALFELEEI